MDVSDNDLVIRYMSGEEAALGELVDRYAKKIYAFTVRLSGDEGLAEDAAQETFVKVWKNLKKFEESGNFKSWIFAIARNSTIDLLRKKRDATFSTLSDGDEFDFAESVRDDAPIADEIFQKDRAKTILKETLEILSIDQKTAVLLHDGEGLTFDEIGEVLGKPMNTVKSHYRRAIEALRKALSGVDL